MHICTYNGTCVLEYNNKWCLKTIQKVITSFPRSLTLNEQSNYLSMDILKTLYVEKLSKAYE